MSDNKIFEKDTNKRIVKNTVVLYLRMLFLMVISFYTSRVVLNALGVVDFGIYNVVGGIVGFMAFINSAMSLATNRFLAFALGKNDIVMLNRMFNMSLEIHVIISVIIIILAETIGLWYFYTYLNIPAESFSSAMWVYQLSVVSCVLSIVSVPYVALATAHEHMSIYAYISIFEGGLKLLVAYLLTVTLYDALKSYALMMCGISVLILLTWVICSTKRYRYVKLRFIWDKRIFSEIFSFTSWQFIGSFSWILRNQGVSLVLNYFFGPALNATRTISLQVNSGITTLVGNFQQAVSPQLVKNYATENIEKMHQLLFQSSKLSFLLLFVIAFPILIVAEPILKLWLNIVPGYATIFVQLMIIATLIDSLSGTLQHCALASGKIKRYTQIVTSILLSDILWVYISFKLGCGPQALLYVEIILYFIAFVARLYVVSSLINLSVTKYLKTVTARELITFIVAAAVIIPIYQLFDTSSAQLFLFLTVAFALTVLISMYIGLTKRERKWIISQVKAKFQR